MQELAFPANTNTLFDLEKTATFLGISTATVRNWVKCGYLATHNEDRSYFFHLAEIENLKANIANGNLEKLSGRANKSKAERTFIPDEYLQDGINVDDITKIVNFVAEKNINISVALLLLSLNLLQKEKVIAICTVQNLINQNFVFTKDRKSVV